MILLHYNLQCSIFDNYIDYYFAPLYKINCNLMVQNLVADAINAANVSVVVVAVNTIVIAVVVIAAIFMPTVVVVVAAVTDAINVVMSMLLSSFRKLVNLFSIPYMFYCQTYNINKMIRQQLQCLSIVVYQKQSSIFKIKFDIYNTHL